MVMVYSHGTGMSGKLSFFCFLCIFFLTLAPSSVKAQIFINEILPDPEGNNPEWVELYNPTSETLSLDHWSLKDTSQPAKSLDGKVISANSFLVFETEEGWLNNSSVETLTLLASDSATIDQAAFDSLPKNQSLSRYPDGSGSWFTTSNTTKGGPNSAPPTPTPQPTDPPPDPTKTPTPQPSPTTALPTKIPTPKLSPTRKPTVTLVEIEANSDDNFSLPTRLQATKTPQVLGESTEVSPPKRNFLPHIFIGLGTLLLVTSGVWIFRDLRSRGEDSL